jgi:hypothetical protein
MPFKKGDMVRYGNGFLMCKVILVRRDWPPSLYDLEVCAPGETVKKLWNIDRRLLISDRVIKPNTYWKKADVDKRVKVISSALDLPAKKGQSKYKYTVQDLAGNQTQDVNGNLLKDGQLISIKEDVQDFNDFIKCAKGDMPLVAIPDSLRDKGFALAFRGDDRPPSQIFLSGFSPRQDWAKPVFRTLTMDKETTVGVIGSAPRFDLFSESGVCASHNPAAACFFPLPKSAPSEDITYLYVFYAYQFFNTFQIQKTISESNENVFAPHKEYLKLIMLGQEIALAKDTIPSETIIGAFKVKRKWTGNNWWDGCTLDFELWEENLKNYYWVDTTYYDKLIEIIKQIPSTVKETPKI